MIKSDNKVKLNIVNNLLSNIYQYYNQFYDYIIQEKDNMRKPIVDELVKKIKPYQFDDKTLYALERASYESHKILFRYILKYRKEVLGLCVKDAIFRSFNVNYQSKSENNEIKELKLKLPLEYYNIEYILNEKEDIEIEGKKIELNKVFKKINKKCDKSSELSINEVTVYNLYFRMI